MNDLLGILWNFPRRVYRKILFEYRVVTGLGSEDQSLHRQPLEKLIFPYFIQDSRWQAILFVGCALYTLWYSKIFAGKDYWTIDVDPAKARMGSSRHIVDTLQNLSRYFSEPYFQLIVLNGVIGWGLNDSREADLAIQACYECLSTGGILIIGWNDIPERSPFPLEDLSSLRRFIPWVFPPHGTWRYEIREPTPYYYDFYAKPD